MMRSILSGLTIAFALASAVPVTAQQQGTEAGAAPSNADANNPLAKFQASNVHNYHVPALSELDGHTILSRGAGQPELQIFIGVNTQFVRK
jgi:hypothetical protein